MSEHKTFLKQRGSILVAALGLSLVLTLAASSLILISGNTSNDQSNRFQRTRCFYDADAGLMYGTEWLRVQGRPAFHVTYATPTAIMTNVPLENGCLVTLEILDFADTTKTITSTAISGNVTIKLAWEVKTKPVGGNPVIDFSNWRTIP
jgi:Tfp pilus assembly protein PilX